MQPSRCITFGAGGVLVPSLIAPCRSRHGQHRCVAPHAQRKRDSSTATRRSKGKQAKSDSDSADDPGTGLAKWQFFSPEAYASVPQWDVPWGWRTTILGMISWAVSFIATGLLSVPIAIELFNLTDVRHISAFQQSEITLLDQIVSTIVGVAIVWSIGASAKEEKPDDFLRFSLERPFAYPDGWLVWGIVGILVAPFVIVLTSTIFSLLPESAEQGRGTVDAVGGMLESIDPGVFTNLLFVTGLLAPILEETVFRGFLLPSLTKYISVPASVAITSLAFACCHLSLRDFPQLFALGMVMGFAYCRSRNLMTSIIIHGAWNSGVMTLLFALLNAGVSMQDIIGP